MKAEQSLVLFWSKKFRKEVARVEWDNAFGRTEGAVRDKREFIVDHSFFGWLEHSEIIFR